jgi:hypothetical protein
MDTEIRTVEPQDVVAHAWYALGYRPTDSLVVVALDGPIRRTDLVLRVDLPPPAQPREVLHHIALRLAERLREAGVRAAVAVVASDRVMQSPPERLIRSLRTVLRQRGVDLHDVIGVTSRAFRSLLCRDDRCCPRSGHPIAAVYVSRAAMMHVIAGDALARGEPTGPRPRGPADRVPHVAPTADAGRDAARPPPTDQDPPPAAGPPSQPRLTDADRERWWRAWTAALDAGALAPGDRAGFCLALADAHLRDGVLKTAMGAPAGGRGPDVDPDWRRRIQRSPSDDLALLNRAVAALEAAVRAAPAGRRADALAVLAVLAWYAGHGERARILATRAGYDQPGHSLAGTMLGLVLLETPPPWGPNGAGTGATEPSQPHGREPPRPRRPRSSRG